MSHTPPPSTDTLDEAENSLPEQRFRHQVRLSSHGIRHVQFDHTFKSGKHRGRWVRRAASSANLCGSQPYVLVGIDAADWPSERQPVDISDVSCKRCRERYERWAAKQ